MTNRREITILFNGIPIVINNTIDDLAQYLPPKVFCRIFTLGSEVGDQTENIEEAKRVLAILHYGLCAPESNIFNGVNFATVKPRQYKVCLERLLFQNPANSFLRVLEKDGIEANSDIARRTANVIETYASRLRRFGYQYDIGTNLGDPYSQLSDEVVREFMDVLGILPKDYHHFDDPTRANS